MTQRTLVLLDSIALVNASHAGTVIVSGSHGGTSAAGFCRPGHIAPPGLRDAQPHAPRGGRHRIGRVGRRRPPPGLRVPEHRAFRLGGAGLFQEAGAGPCRRIMRDHGHHGRVG